MKKIISLLLAMILVFSLTAVAFADTNTETTKGSITINSASEDTYYTIYRLLDLVTYDKTSGAYTYQLNTEWKDFFDEEETKKYIQITKNENHQYADFIWIATDSDATFAEFAKYALNYAIEKGITPVNTTKTEIASKNEGAAHFNAGQSTMVFSELTLGWYLVDSTAGALCGLTTTDPNAAVNAKNVAPSIEKQVEEDLTKIFGVSNTADIGQNVNFMSIVHVQKGLENYVIHDQMTEAFKFEHTATKKGVTMIQSVRSGRDNLTFVENTDYIVKANNAGCTFEIEFTSVGMSKLQPNDRIIVYYHAMLSRYAQAGPTAMNTNETWLSYGEGKTTSKSQTKTFTYSVDIVKTDSSNNLIKGAKFRIYDAQTGGKEIEVVELKDHDEKHILDAQGKIQYRLAREDETGVEIVCETGRVTVIGFDNGTYYLEETQEPQGYNKLTSRQRFDIIDQNLEAAFPDGIYSSGSGVQVVNRTGSMLPETGAMGTSMFILFGMFVMLGTGVLLVTKKRMSMIED